MSKSENKSVLEHLEDEVYNLANNPRLAQFLYYSVIMITGTLLLSFLGGDGYSFGDPVFVINAAGFSFSFGTDFSFMLAWFVLIILLQPPKAAELQSEPFVNTGIIIEADDIDKPAK